MNSPFVLHGQAASGQGQAQRFAGVSRDAAGSLCRMGNGTVSQ